MLRNTITKRNTSQLTVIQTFHLSNQPSPLIPTITAPIRTIREDTAARNLIRFLSRDSNQISLLRKKRRFEVVGLMSVHLSAKVKIKAIKRLHSAGASVTRRDIVIKSPSYSLGIQFRSRLSVDQKETGDNGKCHLELRERELYL
ncbi:hypothetical protein AVEN_239543-1 [Araneus ventricosus]|uniref:Uncharacterized protein n=1 Tax=Araneus ventricosus TaxID=182803 RepID=A0A4Y2HLK9_ARAVE|nr:hypothetical protein AVEN_239543-1 [Araneus ventricosus]